jgi:hypothetical protein
MLVHRKEQNDEFTLVRHNRNKPLKAGDRLRFSVESARPGYLYILTTELYADGASGDTYLIFPALQIGGGSNKVGPGQLVELPAWTDQPGYFTLERSRPDQIAEKITVLVTPERLPGMIATRDPLKVPAEQAADWLKRWGTKMDEIPTGPADGAFRTEAESKAVQEGYILAAKDPAPETLFRSDAAENVPLMVSFELALTK